MYFIASKKEITFYSESLQHTLHVYSHIAISLGTLVPNSRD